MAAVQGEPRLATIAGKWHALARKRLAYVRELERNGRWQLFYTSEAFDACLRDAAHTAQIWDDLVAHMASTCCTAKDERPAA